MGDDDKRKFEPGATMQIDLDQVQLVDLEASAKSRKTPPPLPEMPPMPEMPAPTSTAPAVTSVAPSSRAPTRAASAVNNAWHIGIIVLVVAVAVGAGLGVVRLLRGSPAAAASAVPAVSSAIAAPVKSSEPTGGVLEIPPIEVK
jgi:hypothetical protein